MINLRFTSKIFTALRVEAARLNISVASLVSKIVANAILNKEEPNDREKASS